MRQHLSLRHLAAGGDSRRAALAVALHQPRTELVPLFPNARSQVPGETLILPARRLQRLTWLSLPNRKVEQVYSRGKTQVDYSLQVIEVTAARTWRNW